MRGDWQYEGKRVRYRTRFSYSGDEYEFQYRRRKYIFFGEIEWFNAIITTNKKSGLQHTRQQSKY